MRHGQLKEAKIAAAARMRAWNRPWNEIADQLGYKTAKSARRSLAEADAEIWRRLYAEEIQRYLAEGLEPEALETQRQLMQLRDSEDTQDRKVAEAAAHSILCHASKLRAMQVHVTSEFKREQVDERLIERPGLSPIEPPGLEKGLGRRPEVADPARPVAAARADNVHERGALRTVELHRLQPLAVRVPSAGALDVVGHRASRLGVGCLFGHAQSHCMSTLTVLPEALLPFMPQSLPVGTPLAVSNLFHRAPVDTGLLASESPDLQCAGSGAPLERVRWANLMNSLPH